MKIDQDLRVTMVEVNTLREEHRGVAMGVECQHAVMRMTSLTITASLSHKPLEKRQTVSQGQTWRRRGTCCQAPLQPDGGRS